MAGGIKDFLLSVGMGRHLNMFHTRGYDDESDIPHLNVSDLQTVGITDPMEIIVILKAAHSYKQRPEYDLLRWLRENGLSHYFEGFIQSGRVLLADIAQLNVPDEDVYDELEITLPGHRRRLERAVHGLRKRKRPEGSEGEEGMMVTEGWWGFPSYLPNAKFPFLCVKATIQATRQPDSQQSVDFMVDSGSDVSTLRDEVVQMLNLEPITTVRSFGAHGSVRTTMYRAFITIGDCKLEIEIIGSSYDSLGSRVLRHFNHRIDSSRHKWYRTNNNAVSHCTSSGGQAMNNTGENTDTEAETVSVLPERERGTPYSRIFPDNPSSSTTRGDGGSTSCGDGRGDCDGQSYSQTGGAAVQGDEADSVWLPPQQKSTTDSSWLSPSSQQYRSPSSSHSNKCSRSSSDTTGRAYCSADGYSQMSHERILGTSSGSHASLHGASLWTNEQVMASPSTSQRTSTGTHQSGHLMISEDGTISLSFGREIRRKREWEDADGS